MWYDTEQSLSTGRCSQKFDPVCNFQNYPSHRALKMTSSVGFGAKYGRLGTRTVTPTKIHPSDLSTTCNHL